MQYRWVFNLQVHQGIIRQTFRQTPNLQFKHFGYKYFCSGCCSASKPEVCSSIPVIGKLIYKIFVYCQV